MLKRLLIPVVALLVALAPTITTEAAVTPHVVYDGLTFTSNASGNGCTGTLVGVYGSSALKNYVLGTAAAYCSTQTSAPYNIPAASAIDVEYKSGGDSCPGVDFAADDSTDPVVGVSDVFSSGCTGAFARAASKIKDNNASVNIVNAITNCGAAVQSPQGGDPFSSSLVACSGSAVTHGGCGTANTFPYPDDLSVQQSQLLWAAQLADISQVGGCTTGSPPTIQVRTAGSGTRATWCYNIYGIGVDNCAGTVTDQSGSGGLVGAICGKPSSVTGVASVAPTDPTGTIGHTSRATIVIDPNYASIGANDSIETKQPISQCGIVGLGGHSGYNQNCDPLKAAQSIAQPYSGTDGAGKETCKGDLEIATGVYTIWGYEHFDTNANATPSSQPAIYGAASGSTPGGYLTFVLGNAVQENRLLGFGFMRACQMQFTRSPDAGPYALNADSLGNSLQTC